MITKLSGTEATIREPTTLGLQKDDRLLEKSRTSLESQRIRRIYRGLALNFYRKQKKRLAARTALALGVPVQSNLTWSLDFMSDSLSNGRAIRTLNIIDDYNREALWIEVDHSLPAERVVRVLENLLLWRAAPKQIRMDNGPEFISKRLENWAREKQIELMLFSRANLHKMHISNASTARFVKMF